MDVLTSLNAQSLRDLCREPAPIASIYFGLRAIEDDTRSRWKAIAHELAEQGAGPLLIERLRTHVLDAIPGHGVLAAFTTGEKIALSSPMPDASLPDRARYGDLPHLLPALEWLQSHPPHAVVVLDRQGAELTVHPGGAAPPIHRTIHGPDDEIERNAPGGWAQARYQRRAEDSWEHNAKQIVEELLPLIRRHAVRLLIVAGDVRTESYLEKHLPGPLRQKLTIRRVSGSRGQDGAQPLRAEQITADVLLAVSDRDRSMLALLDEERRPGGRAVLGSEDTLAALRAGRVQVLLLTDDAGRPRSAWYGPNTDQIAAEPEELQRLGVQPRRASLVDIATRTALLTKARPLILPASTPPETLPDGIGALCRFAEQTQRPNTAS